MKAKSFAPSAVSNLHLLYIITKTILEFLACKWSVQENVC